MLDTTGFEATIGVDIAKNIFQAYTVDQDGVQSNRAYSRPDFLPHFANRKPCLIGMEACGTSQHWARELEKMGHSVYLMHPKAVKAYVKGRKNDKNDAVGIYNAMLFGDLHPIPVRYGLQRDLDALLTERDFEMNERVRHINHIRGQLAEYGVVMGKSVKAFDAGIDGALKTVEAMEDVDEAIVRSLRRNLARLRETEENISLLDKDIDRLARQCPMHGRFLTAPGVGPIVAAKMDVILDNPRRFKNGRHFSAHLGLAPLSFGSGGKNVVTSIPRFHCDVKMRALLIQSAHAICRCKNKSEWVENILKRKPKKVALVAIANKLARQLWAMAAKGENWVEKGILAAPKVTKG